MVEKEIGKNKYRHMEACAKYMRERAEAYGLDKEEMYVLGLVHDIGYLEGYSEHEIHGAQILERFGAKPENIFAVKYHGTNAYKILKEMGRVPREYVLLLEADLSINSYGENVGFEKRLEEIKGRYKNASPALNNINFVKEYWNKHNILPPE